MWRIFQFLGKFGNVILFLFLELVALLIVITVNKPQREVSQGIFLDISGSMSEFQANIGSYFNLKSENAILQEEFEGTLQALQEARDSLRVYKYRRPTEAEFLLLPDSLRQDSVLIDSMMVPVEIPDSLFPAKGFDFLPCKAINNTVSRSYNYITIDKGARHGIREGMGLISPKGVAGQIVDVSRNYSLAQSVLNKKFNLSAKIKGNKNIGNVVWQGFDPEYATLKFIPQTSVIHVGDTVLTSGYSTIFPPDYLVGTVSDFNAEQQDGFFTVKVKLATNFRGTGNMFVVTHEHKAEIDSLENQFPQE